MKFWIILQQSVTGFLNRVIQAGVPELYPNLFGRLFTPVIAVLAEFDFNAMGLYPNFLVNLLTVLHGTVHSNSIIIERTRPENSCKEFLRVCIISE